MKMRVTKKLLKTYEEALILKGYQEAAKSFVGYFRGSDDSPVEIDLECNIDIELTSFIKDIANENDDKLAVYDMTVLIQHIQNPDTTTVKSLKGFIRAFETYIKTDQMDGWLYKSNDKINHIPYLITDAYHVPAKPEYQQKAYAIITITATSTGGSSEKEESI